MSLLVMPVCHGQTGLTRYEAALEAYDAGRYEEAFAELSQLLREDPGNVDINFAYGLACYARKDYSRSGLAFRRVLSLDPTNHRARLELARTEMSLGQLDLAREHFLDVLAQRLPQAVRDNVERLLAQIETGQKAWRVTGRVDVGAFHDDNINIGPDTDRVTIAPLIVGPHTLTSLEVDDASKPTPAGGLFAALSIFSSHELGAEGGWNMTYDGACYQNVLRSDADYESTFYQVASGPRLSEAGRVAHFPLMFSHIRHGGEILVDIWGVSPFLLTLAGQSGNCRWLTSGRFEYRDYHELDDRDGTYLIAGEQFRRLWSRGRHSFSGGLWALYDLTDASEYERVGISGAIGCKRGLGNESCVFGRLRLTQSQYDGREVLAPERRSDTEFQYLVGATKAISRDWGLTLSYVLTQNRSTFDLYQYDRLVVTLNTFRTF